MRNTVRARLHWLSPDEGGRSRPAGSPYSTVARFEETADEWPRNGWSLVAEFERWQPDMVAEVHFLFDEAPQHLLHLGSRFEFMEGRRVVALGQVVDIEL